MKRLLIAALLLAGTLRAQVDTEQVDIGTIDAPTWSVPSNLVIRVRITALTPAEPSAIQWRFGGEGLGGNVTKGSLTKPDGTTSFAVGEWSSPVSVWTFKREPWPRMLFVTFWAGRAPKFASRTERTPVDYTTGVALEFEVSHAGQVVRTFTETAADGNTLGLVIWPERWANQEQPNYAAGFMGLLEYVTDRATQMEKLPWGKDALPKKFSIVTDFGGYGVVNGYAVRHSSPAVVAAEARTLRQLGVNGLRAAPAFLVEAAKKNEGIGRGFDRTRIVQIGGYPVVPMPRVKTDSLEVACPFSDQVLELTAAGVERALAEMSTAGTPEVWGLTVDEIGVVFDHAAAGKAHVAICPRCQAEFHKLLQRAGVKPADLGKKEWAEVKPFIASPKNPDLTWLKQPGLPLTAYYTRRFLADASVSLFTPLRDSVAAANAASETPFRMYTYALRGNTFLLGGHSLDFFDFYRKSDNGFVYETSNRDSRVHQWDSYLCDVGRVVSAENKLAFGVYVKPHRGAVIQRAITAASRGATMLFWYTYGPDYAKGDSFSASTARLDLTSKAAHLIAKAEDALYGAKWAQPARIGIVKPNTTEHWLALTGKDPVWAAAWENAKWIYTVLAHEHLPVDPLDEGILEDRDLSAYKVIYVHGPNLRRSAAAKLAQWVKDGGTLYTSGWGLTRDEANEPLDTMLPVLGLEARKLPEMYTSVGLYVGGTVDSFNPTGEAKLQDLTLKVGREILTPVAGAEVLARFADGKPALTRHAYGKGQAYVAGFFPGLEYSAGVRNAEYDMSKQFDPAWRKFVNVGQIQPVVDAPIANVEGVLLTNNGQRSVALMNWAYRVSAVKVTKQGRGERRTALTTLVEQQNLPVTIRGAGPVKKVRSAMLDKELPFQQQGDVLRVTVPVLQEADVLLLD
ncbi:MAG: hypothetical protein PCFJNLEI_02592 [Verrucomicrobiae bacterium]|nr:hypothetical protein [Verrucomicrobiae bacterium]